MKPILRSMVRGAYDLQRLRIATGLRVVANWKVKLGQQPGRREEDDLDEDAKDLLKQIRATYKRISDAVTEKAKGRKRPLASAEQFAAVGPDPLISNYAEYALCHGYFQLDADEQQQFAAILPVLENFPIWTKFLKPIKGIGPAMGGVIVSEIDIEKAHHVSSLWKYAGFDVVTRWKLVRAEGGNAPESNPLHPKDGPAPIRWAYSPDGKALSVDYPGGIRGSYVEECRGGRSMRAEHLTTYKYKDKKGEDAERQGITFNPFLKTKMFLLADLFVKFRTSPYRDIYDAEKERLAVHPVYGKEHDGEKDVLGLGVRPKRRDNMAKRRAVKAFLADLWVAWRKLENLPVSEPYFNKLRKFG